MSFRQLIEGLDQACLNVFKLTDDSGTPIAITLQPQGGGQPIDLTGLGIVSIPALPEDYVPGDSHNVSVIRLFVRFVDIATQPQKGDKVTINGTNYDVGEVDVDREGGAVLKLRRNG